MIFEIPKSIRLEHEELHRILNAATLESGSVGSAAKAVAAILHPHFAKEEEFAMPPLGLLPELSKGHASPEMSGALEMTSRLKNELGQMLKEHKEIVVKLEKLSAAAKRENKLEYVRFVEKLTLHAQNEEEVLYPASILIGEYLAKTVFIARTKN